MPTSNLEFQAESLLCVHQSLSKYSMYEISKSMVGLCGILYEPYSCKTLLNVSGSFAFLLPNILDLTCSKIESCEILPLQIRGGNLPLEISVHSCN